MKTLDDNKEMVSTLNDLVKINNDRVEGYEKAAEQAKDNPTLQSMFREKASDSKKFASELQQHVTRVGGEQTNKTTIPGKVYRSWMDLKNTFKPADKTSILESCEFGEDAALKVYDMALKSNTELDSEVRKKILEQRDKIKISHNQIKSQREISKNIK